MRIVNVRGIELLRLTKTEWNRNVHGFPHEFVFADAKYVYFKK